MAEQVSRIRVVVADDVPQVRDGLAAVIGADPRLELVATVRDGHEASAVALALEPDVVVMDLRMGGADGITATRLVTAALPRVGVVMYTAYSDQSLVDDAHRAGAAAYLPKGTAARELIATLVRVAGERRDLPRTAADQDALRQRALT